MPKVRLQDIEEYKDKKGYEKIKTKKKSSKDFYEKSDQSKK